MLLMANEISKSLQTCHWPQNVAVLNTPDNSPFTYKLCINNACNNQVTNNSTWGLPRGCTGWTAALHYNLIYRTHSNSLSERHSWTADTLAKCATLRMYFLILQRVLFTVCRCMCMCSRRLAFGWPEVLRAVKRCTVFRVSAKGLE